MKVNGVNVCVDSIEQQRICPGMYGTRIQLLSPLNELRSATEVYITDSNVLELNGQRAYVSDTGMSVVLYEMIAPIVDPGYRESEEWLK